MGPLALGLLLGLRPVLSGPEMIRDIQQFRVHYTLAGEDAPARGAADVDAVEAGITRVITHWVGEVGMRAPLPDRGDGGDDRIDVYLRKLDARGRTHVEDVGQPQAASAWIELDPRTGLVSSARLSAAAGHETFHAVQYAYSPSLAPWIHEASATWVEDSDFVDPALAKEVEAHYAGIFDHPEVPLDRIDGVHEYDAMVFVKFLVEWRGSEQRMRTMWEAMAAARDAIVGMGAESGRSFDELIQAFAVENAAHASARGIGTVPAKAYAPLEPLAMAFLGVPAPAVNHRVIVKVRNWVSVATLGNLDRGAPWVLVLTAGAAPSPDLTVELYDVDESPKPYGPRAPSCIGSQIGAGRSPRGALPIALLVSLLVVRRGRSRGGRARP